ncbi:DEAD/DEAH box helicase [Alteriqipengyuania flavescens]|uniref:DEAD/DEAH box helicase n=1 Tax=Alteriqipengyuania flavescens TaxID=3053610 RepID=UPI0025B29E1A|nr:DEAD/DEAH box helicase [Alteriqipengyuania flavescens]WJY19834.1 DEAD/DEAH box helicase [Alteriqipengyuania flavescens]WJY25776.1 DEAD/DEAH box helicase [Alteriqipengyuania flavescens]
MRVREAFGELCDSGKLTVVERVEIPGREERVAPIPDPYRQDDLSHWLNAKFGQDETVWNHQAVALEQIDDGQNVVIATGTASGKSLIFQLPIMRELLEGDGVAIVIYPLKALLSDQLSRWRLMALELGLPANTVAELHGDIRMDERHDALQNARIVAITPDLLQAWFMRQVSAPLFKQFLAKLRFLVIDEAHVYESVFGSNVAYLMRRFLIARNRAAKDLKSQAKLQIIAATATIYSPVDHMACLTGWEFVSVDDVDDGSPSHPRTLLHIDGPEIGGPGESMLQDIIQEIGHATQDSFIAFHNSRQGVERVTRAIDRDDILPYRSGYEGKDRARIEQQLREGELRGVVSTSALEVGIDVSGFTVGLNLGVPQSKKAFRQRLGRVGRASPGIFAVVAPRHAFTQLGSSFQEYFEGSVEPSYLYLDNRFIQFAHARCLMDESEQLGFSDAKIPPGVQWPESFEKVYEAARPGIRRPKEFELIAQIGADAPHFNYPLRQVGEPNYKLKEGSHSDPEQIGGIALNQAIREAYPGALYLHLKRPMKVSEWKSNSFDRSIRLYDASKAALTRPILYKSVMVGVSSDEIIAGSILSGERGLLAEVSLQVNEAVLGFQVGGKQFLYKELRAKDPKMTKKQREFGTTGVVIQIKDEWFSGSGQQRIVRQAVADALRQMILREKSIAPTDIDEAHSHISYYQAGVPKRATDTIVVYDSIYGGLRLTEPLFQDFDDFLEKLQKAAAMAGGDALVSGEIIEKLVDWYESLQEGTLPSPQQLAPPNGELVVYEPGSVVSVRMNGTLVERELLGLRFIDMGGSSMLVYKYKNSDEGDSWVPHDQVEPTGQDWKQVFWNPQTETFTDPEEDEGSF